jgi:hypothetical protein
VRRRCDGMGPDAEGCWSWELEDAGGATCLRLYASWRRLSCGRTTVPDRGPGSGARPTVVSRVFNDLAVACTNSQAPGRDGPGASYGGEENAVGAQCRPSVYCNHDITVAGLLPPAPGGAATPGERAGLLQREGLSISSAAQERTSWHQSAVSSMRNTMGQAISR